MSRADINANLPKCLEQPRNQVGIKSWQHAVTALKDSNLRAGMGSDVRKFRCNITAADHHNAFGQTFKLHEGIACRQMLRARKGQWNWMRAAGNQDVTAPQHLATNFNRIWCNETSRPVESANTLLFKTSLPLFRDRISEGALEGNEIFPIDLNFASHALRTHPVRGVEYFRPA